jgi:hypothetical protein
MDAWELTELAFTKYGFTNEGDWYGFVNAVLDKGMTHDEAAEHVKATNERLRKECPALMEGR